MTTYRVFPSSYAGPLGSNEIRLGAPGANIDVSTPGDTFIIDPSMDSSFGVDNAISSSPIDVNVVFEASNTGISGTATMNIRADVNPNITVADGADISNINVSAPFSVADMENFTLDLGAASSLGRVAVGGSGNSSDALEISFTLGDGATLGDGTGDAIAAGGGYLDYSFNAGENVVLDGDMALGGSFGTYDVSFGNNSMVTGNFSWGGSQNTYIGNFGDDFQLQDNFFLGGSSNTHQLTFGNNAMIDGVLAVGGGSNTNTFLFGDNATITGTITGSTSGTETWTFGQDWRFDGSFNLQGGDDTLILGQTSQDSGGTINAGSGSDTLRIAVPSANQSAFDAAVAAAGWTDNGDGTYATNGNSLIYNGVTYAAFEAGETFVCFSSGTRIATPDGDRLVEDLRTSDLITTQDAGPQPIIWIGRRTLDFRQASSRAKPIELKAGCLGRGRPQRDLVVSPQHRILLDGPDIQTKCGAAEALAPAKGLLGRRGVRVKQGCQKVTYHTILLTRHHVILANNAPVESFYPGAYAIAALGHRMRHEVLLLFPDILKDRQTGFGPFARPVLSRREAEILCLR